MDVYDENNNEWFNKDRLETTSNRVASRELDHGIASENLALGLDIYKNTFSLEDANRYIEVLESNLSSGKRFKWSEAQVKLHHPN